MYCENCGNEFKPGETECSVCHSGKGEVKILTTEEKRSFQGMTIEADDDAQEGNGRQQGYGAQGNVRFKYKVINLGGNSLFTKLIVAGILLFLIVVALPVVVFGAGLALLIWFILRMLSR